MAKITIYNDDPHGRAIQVLQINPYGTRTYEPKIQEASTDSGGPGPEQYEVRNGELLIITTAEKDIAGG